MNKIITGLILVSSLGLASISSQTYAGERGHRYDNHSYSNESDEHRAYRKDYRDARREYRQHRKYHRAKWQQRNARSHNQHKRYENRHDRHQRVSHHQNYDWRVIFKF